MESIINNEVCLILSQKKKIHNFGQRQMCTWNNCLLMNGMDKYHFIYKSIIDTSNEFWKQNWATDLKKMNWNVWKKLYNSDY